MSGTSPPLIVLLFAIGKYARAFYGKGWKSQNLFLYLYVCKIEEIRYLLLMIGIIDAILFALVEDETITSKEDFHKLKNTILAAYKLAE